MMHFLGLPFATLATYFAIAGGAIVVLYILRLRRRAITVPFVSLWERLLRDRQTTSLFSRLKRILSLLLQLLLLLLLLFALADPRTAVEIIHGRTLVVLVDTSASMKTIESGGKSRIDLARDKVRDLAKQLGASDRMLIASMDAVVTPLSPMTSEISVLEKSADTIRATDCAADFAKGIRFAIDSLRNAKDAQIVIVSDGGLGPYSAHLKNGSIIRGRGFNVKPGEALTLKSEEGDTRKIAAADIVKIGLGEDAQGEIRLPSDISVSYIPIGSKDRNVAITEFAVRRYPLDRNRYEVMIELQNMGVQEEDVELSLLGDGLLVDLVRIHLKPATPFRKFYPSLAGAQKTLEAKLVLADGKVDDLDADNHAYAVLPERHRTKVLAISADNTYLEAALVLDEYLDVTEVDPKDMASALGSDAKYDVAIFDGVTPSFKPGLPSIYLNPSAGGPVKVGGDVKSPEFTTLMQKHPILRWTALDNVGIATAKKLGPDAGDKVVGASNGEPILVAGTRNGTKFVALGFDIRQSDFPLRIGWPVFLLNCINWFVDDDADYMASFRTGDVWHVPAPVGAKSSATLIAPNQKEYDVPIVDGRAVFLGTESGFYKLRPHGTTEHEVMFAANIIDADESQIKPQSQVVVDGKIAGVPSTNQNGVRKELWIYLLAAVIILSALEWISYHRRVTV